MDLRFAAILLFWVGSVGAGLLCLHRFLLTRNLKKKAQDLPSPSKYFAQKCVALSESSPPNTVPLLDTSYGYLPRPTTPYNIQSSNEHQFSCLFSNPSGIAEQYFCGPPLAHLSQHDLPKPLYTTCILPKSDLYNLAAEARFKALGSLPFQDQFNGFYRPDSFSSIDRGYVASHYNGHLSSVADLVQADPVQAIVPKKLHGIGETGTSMTGCDSAHVIGMEEPMDSPLVSQRENLGQRGLSTLSLLEDQILHEKYMEALGKTEGITKQWEDLGCPPPHSSEHDLPESSGPKDWSNYPPNTVPLLDSSYGYLPLPTPPYNIQSSNEHQFSCLFSNPSGIAEQYFCGPPLAHSSQHDLPEPLDTTGILPKSDLYNLAADYETKRIEARFNAMGSLPFQDPFNGFYRPDSFRSIDRGYLASHYNGHLSSVADLVQADTVQAITPKKLHGIGETGTSMTGCDSAHVIGMEEPMDSPLDYTIHWSSQRENLGQRGLPTLSLLGDQILHEQYMEAPGKTEGITKQWQDLGCPPPHSSEHDLPESSGPKDWSNWYKEIWWNCAIEMLREAKKKMGTLPGQDPSYGLLRLHQSSRMGPLPNDEGYLRDFSGSGLSNAPLSAVKTGPLLDTAMDELLHQSSRMGSPPNDEGYVRDFSGPGISNAALSAGENGPLLDTAMDKLLHQSSRMGPLPNDEGYVIDFSGPGLSNAPLSAVENGPLLDTAMDKFSDQFSRIGPLPSEEGYVRDFSGPGLSNAPLSAVENGPLLDTAMDKSLCSGGAATPLTPLTGYDSADMILLRCINSHGREKLG